MKVSLWLILVIMVISMSHQLLAQRNILVGPVLAGSPVGGGVMTFEDVGSGYIWQIKLSDSYSPGELWSPDGCKLLLRGNNSWDIISIMDGYNQSVPGSLPSVKSPVWHPDSNIVTFTVSSR